DAHAAAAQLADDLVILGQLGRRPVSAGGVWSDRFHIGQGTLEERMPLERLFEVAPQHFGHFRVFPGQVSFEEIFERHSNFPNSTRARAVSLRTAPDVRPRRSPACSALSPSK